MVLVALAVLRVLVALAVLAVLRVLRALLALRRAVYATMAHGYHAPRIRPGGPLAP